MKRFLVAAVAAISLLAVVGCSSPTDNSTTPPSNVSQWKIKGSVDGWAEHNLTISDTNANSLTYSLTGLYQDSVSPLVYEFVLVNPAGVEYKYSGTSQVTPGTAVVLGDSSAAASTSVNNVKFVAAKSSYTVTVDITTASAPSVNLIAGSTVAPSVTNSVLLSNLQIKGDQFSKINTVAVAAWTATAGTVSGNTMTWDLYVDNKLGSFGFNSINGWLAHNDIDTTALTANGNGPTTAVEMKVAGSGNMHLTNTYKANSVYTLTATVDSTKAPDAGRYMLTATLKTVGTTNWAFTPWATVFLAGAGAEFGNWTPGSFVSAPISNGIATKQITASATAEQFKVVPQNAWGGDLGFAGVDVAAGSITLSSNGGNIGFTAVVGTTYTITVDFTTANYIANGVPTVKVVTP